MQRAIYDEFDSLRTETNELNKTTIYTYDPADNSASIEDPLHNVTQITYNQGVLSKVGYGQIRQRPCERPLVDRLHALDHFISCVVSDCAYTNISGRHHVRMGCGKFLLSFSASQLFVSKATSD